MHAKYAKKGVVCVSVSVDQVDDKEDVLKFLKKVKATLVNYLLDERPKVWKDHFGVVAPPAVFVYDRDGKFVRKFEPGEEFSYADVEKVVQKVLAKG
jgi:cytochrome oxidase Cu insertion factor (SCO1/SenC/PrrC family)